MLIIGHRRCQPASVVGGASDHAPSQSSEVITTPYFRDCQLLFSKRRSTPFFKPLMPPPLQPLEASDWTLVFVTSAAVQKVGQIASRCRWGYEYYEHRKGSCQQSSWNWTMLWDVLDQLYSD
jgi:hypothetical protein